MNLRCNYLAPINNFGYGVAGLNFLNSLSKLGVDLAYFPIGQIELTDPSYQQVIQAALNNQANYDHNAPSLRIFHQFSLAEHVGKGIRIGYPIFELDRFTDREIHHMQNCDELLVCSYWAQSVCADHGLKTKVVPLGVDTSIFFPTNQPRWTDETVFINLGKIEIRKGHDVLIEAFNAAFDPSDRVRLQLLWFNPFISEQQTREWESLYKNSKMGAHIDFVGRKEYSVEDDEVWTTRVVYQKLPTHHDVAKLMNRADCGVFPARAEGWNLELLEMMACGKHCITTDYSGHTEYANEQNSMMVHLTEKESAFDGVFFFNQGNWGAFGETQMDELVEHLRSVHKRVQDSSLRSNEAGLQTARSFTWDNAAKKLMEILF